MHGTLNLTTTGLDSSSGTGTKTVIFERQPGSLNTALATLIYTPALNYNGTDTLKIITTDLGNTGDANGNLMPNELADALTDSDKLLINITPVNDPPVGVNDIVFALEKGGSFNTVGGYPGVINVLKNDIDVDIATKPADVLSVTKIGLGATATMSTGSHRLHGCRWRLRHAVDRQYRQYQVHHRQRQHRGAGTASEYEHPCRNLHL